MVEALLAQSLASRGGSVRVHSAGLLESGRPASSGALEVMADRGIDISGHRSTHLTPELVRSADLILGMAREHVREAVVLDFSSFSRTFTLKEIVRRGGELGRQQPDETTAEWLTRLSSGRRPADHLGSSPDDDVADPIGQRLAVYRRTADELVALVDRLAQMFDVSTPAEIGASPSSPEELS